MTDYLGIFLVSLSAIFFVVDPIGLVPLFLGMTAGDSAQKRNSTALRACLTGGGLLLFFALFGGVIFKVFAVTLGAFRVAGGLLLLITALDMLNARTPTTRTSPGEEAENEKREDVALVPLAIPLLAGPGAIATAMVLMSQGTTITSAIPVLLAIVITFVATYFILRGASFVQRVLKQTGVALLERVMGLILAAIAVQFIADGGRALLFPPGG